MPGHRVGVSAPGGEGGGAWSGGCLVLGGGLVPGEGVSAPGGGAWSWGVSAPGGSLLWKVPGPRGCLFRGEYLVQVQGVSQHALRQTPPCEQNDRQVQKYYLAPNFVCER